MLDWLQIVLRTLAAIIALFVLTKLLGKRQVSQLSLFEYITGITIGNLAAYISLDLDNLWYLGVISLCVWVGVSVAIEYWTMKNKKASDIIDGKATVLIQDGQLLKEEMFKEKLTLDELLRQLRKKNVFRVADVEFAIMEASGELNVLLKKEYQPITPDMLGWKTSKEKSAQDVIMDGEIMEGPLQTAGYDRHWLEREIKRQNLTVKDVFLAQIDADDQLQIYTKDGLKYPNGNQSKPAHRLAALTEQFEAELVRLERFARNEPDRRMYQSALDRFQSGFKSWPEKAD